MGTLYQSIVEMKELSMGFDQKNTIVDTIVEICFIWTVAITEIEYSHYFSSWGGLCIRFE